MSDSLAGLVNGVKQDIGAGSHASTAESGQHDSNQANHQDGLLFQQNWKSKDFPLPKTKTPNANPNGNDEKA